MMMMMAVVVMKGIIGLGPMLRLRVFDDKAGKWQRKQWLDDLAEWLVKTVPEPVRLTEDRVITVSVAFVESPIWFPA